MKFLHIPWKFHGYIFNALGKKLPPEIPPVDLKANSHGGICSNNLLDLYSSMYGVS